MKIDKFLLFLIPILWGSVFNPSSRSSSTSLTSNGNVSAKTKSATTTANNCPSHPNNASKEVLSNKGSNTVTPPQTKEIIKIFRKGKLLKEGNLLTSSI